ncbi:MAG: phosphate ABC transporter permease subunit PstC [Holosporales bacterium]
MSWLMALFFLLISGFYGTRARMRYITGQGTKPAVMPKFYGYVTSVYGAMAFALVFLLCTLTEVAPPILTGFMGALAVVLATMMGQSSRFHARRHMEGIIRKVLLVAALIAVVLTFAIVLSLALEALQFFQRVPLSHFLFGTSWAPQSGASGEAQFGIIPLLGGTLMITGLALSLALPLGLMSAVFLSEYASSPQRKVLKPMVEVLAGIPTIVYGFFAISIVMPGLQHLGEWLHIPISAESALGVSLVMGLLILPLIASLSDDALRAVPQALRDNSLALGATEAETILRVVLPAATPGIIAGFLLGLSRAIGETMLVVMAAGLSANLTLNPLESVTTITVQIVSLLTGDQEYGSTRTLSAFALGLVLFVLTFLLNILAVRVVRHYREKYA